MLNYTIQSAGLNDGQHIVDAGCGVGGPAIHFAKHLDISIQGLTISEKQVAAGKSKIRAQGLENKIQIQKGDYHFLDQIYEKESADAVLFLESLGHSDRPVQVIQAAHKVIKEGGFIYIKDFFQREFINKTREIRTQKVIENLSLIHI